MKIRLLIGDDHAVVRKGMKQILAETKDIVVADEACNGREVLEKVRKSDFDMVLLDISMPGRDGLEILKELKSLKPKLPVLMLSMYPEEQYAVRSLRSGASGYLTKDSAPDELISAIRKVSSGGKYVSASLAEKLAHKLGADVEKPLHEALSDREYQVMCMIASGKTVKEIGEELSLSVKTVSTYRSRILDKMRLKGNAELTRYAIDNKLVS
jgi:two-component system invasion response regulator UvrY